MGHFKHSFMIDEQKALQPRQPGLFDADLEAVKNVSPAEYLAQKERLKK